ncbi:MULTISPECIES: autotransporter outer membrane beta-barrel domain-containing protein [unclassified Anaerobiospirillum]|uniref:autotransporter domain-containing protein n=1 Tax=unclassified Anaerobiospirillum TaxID=2647410 RepID=UPI001FF26B6D|nr:MULTISPECIES: autotransporter outer membrane beta-barrel domain-containing protein [unclassified Anaerobiospirillum]MCK0535091.1 autotransporter outer membrane beta-barrel domain-containing protein [Anaerobiospirillum sp. NML120511]MCK0540264.1 autotransporter outer membrane beta-barrel domain-containing protein [Anaerobiospirillum sp. NML02-A-032]
MKLSNNAIKFLMAQYRAIYKNAYFKGIASAVVLTAGMAAGAAQAASPSAAVDDKDAWAGLTGEVEIVDDTNKIDLSGGIDGSADANNLTVLDLQSGDSTIATTAQSGATVTAKNATLKVSSSKGGDAATLTLSTNQDGKKASLTVAALDVIKGTVTVEGKTASTADSTLNAGVISIGSSEGSAESKVVLGTASNLVSEIKAGELSELGSITIGSAGSIATKTGTANVESVAVKAPTLNISGGLLKVYTAEDKTSAMTVSVVQGALNGGKIEVGRSGALTVNFDNTSGIKEKGKDAERKFELNSGNVTLTNELKFSGAGTLYVKEATITGGGDLKISGSGSAINISKDKLTSLIGGAKLTVKNTEIKLNDNVLVDVGGIDFGNAAGTGKINVDTAVTVSAADLQVSKPLTGNNKNLVSVKADNLTLGSSTYGNANALGFSGATAKNVTFKSSQDAFKLQDSVTLSNVNSDKVAQKGEISGNLNLGTSGKGLTIDGGKYEIASTDTVTLGSGSLTVKNSSGASESVMTVKGKLEIATGATGLGTAKVDGAKSKLDLTQAKITVTGDGKTGAAGFAADKGGTIVISEEAIKSALTVPTKPQASKAAIFKIGENAESTLKIDGGLAIAAGHLKKDAADYGIDLQKGTVEITGDLVTSGADALDLAAATADAANAKVVANTISHSNANAGNATEIKSGSFFVNSGLSTDSTLGFKIAKDGKLTLGSFVDVKNDSGTVLYQTGVGGGEIAGDLTVSGDGASVKVNFGTWNAGKIDLQSGSFIVGDTAAKDANGDLLQTSIDATEVKVAAAKSITLNKAATLSADSLKVDGTGFIDVNGKLNINTSYDGSEATSGDVYARYGLTLGDDAIKIKEGGTVTLAGEGVLNALGIVDGKEVTADSITKGLSGSKGVFADAGSFVDAKGSTLAIKIGDSGTSFTTEALEKLKDALFSGTLLGSIDIGAATMGLPIKDVEGNKVLDWNDAALSQASKDVMPTYKNDELKGTILVAKDGDTVYGHVANIKVDSADATSIKIDKKASLNKAAENGNLVYNKKGEVLGVDIQKDAYLTLNAAGNVGAVKLGQGATLDVATAGGTTNLNSVSGTGVLAASGNLNVKEAVNVGKLTSVETSNISVGTNLTVGDTPSKVSGKLTVGGNAQFKGATTVNGDVNVAGTFKADKTLDTAKGSSLKVTSGSFTAADDVTALGVIEVTGSGSVADFKADAKLAGDGNKFVDVKFGQLAEIHGDTVAAGTATVSGNLEVRESAGFTAKKIEFSGLTADNSGKRLSVGTAGREETSKGAGDGVAPSNAYLSVESLKLNGASLVVDPDYDMGASVAAVKGFSDAKAEAEGVRGFAGTVDGNIYALQNSIVALGSNDVEAVKGTFAKYFDEKDGSLGANGISSIAYVAESISVKDGNKIVIDPEGTDDKVNNDYQEDFDLNISEKSALAVDYQAVKDGKTAVTFAKKDAKVYVDKTDAKVLLTGKGFSPYYDIKLFGSSAGSGSVSFVDGSATELTVETLNGLFSAVITDLNKSFELGFNEKKARVMMGHISEPVRESIITYTMGDLNYTEQDPKKLVSVVGDATGYKVDAKGSLLGDDGKAVALDKMDPTEKKQLIADGILNAAGTAVSSYLTKDTEGNLYYIPENVIFNGILDGSLDAVDAETAARLADFGGVAQAALRAGNTTSDAIAARMGVGVNGTVTFAANGQGSGMWVTPVYKTADSDSFGADGVDYGTDMNLYGVAVGADVSVMENVSAGVMFNVGSGDADGQGLGSNVKNDFDYYGFGAYMGYTMGAASVVADVSWTTVDNSVEGQTGLGTLAASIDSSALSLGVTGKYAMDFGGVNVTPHAGLRFTRIDQDDYSVGNGTDVFAQYSSNSMNVFSVPVGVTVEKEYTFDAWSVKPAFDLTLTGNFGDDETSGTVDWEGISNLSTDIKSEFVDTFTYSTAIGVAAQTGNFGMGLGVNYTGASNVKEFGVNANVRYVF